MFSASAALSANFNLLIPGFEQMGRSELTELELRFSLGVIFRLISRYSLQFTLLETLIINKGLRF